MNESDLQARVVALTQLLNELKARLDALQARLVAAEQSQAQRWYGAGSSS